MHSVVTKLPLCQLIDIKSVVEGNFFRPVLYRAFLLRHDSRPPTGAACIPCNLRLNDDIFLSFAFLKTHKNLNYVQKKLINITLDSQLCDVVGTLITDLVILITRKILNIFFDSCI